MPALQMTETGELLLPMNVVAMGDYAIVARDDSMNKARIHDGDVMVVEYQTWAEDGEIVIAAPKDGGSAYYRRYRETQEGAYLMPESHSLGYEPIKVDQGVTLLGVVRWVHQPGIELN